MATSEQGKEALAVVRAYAILFAGARQDRDTAIHRAREAGCTLRQIAKVSDLSKDAVQAILDRT